MYYIFYGEDEFSRSEALAHLRGQMAGGDPAMAELNTSILDGAKLTVDELRHTCDAMPFMADRRLVIVRGLLGRLTSGRKGKKEITEQLSEYLPSLPETTRLFFVEEGDLKASHPILKLAKSMGKAQGAYVRHFKLPQDRELPAWVRRRAADKGGDLSTEAVTLLVTLVGADLRLLDQEIEKLMLYADGRQVTTDDVRALVSRARETSIFDLVDCVGRREPERALRLLHHMLEEGAAPLYLLTMLARQVRILIQVTELREQGLSPREMAKRLKLHPYVVEKGLAQARRFEMAQLEAAHRRVVQTDWAIKTGEMEDVLALEMLVVALTRR